MEDLASKHSAGTDAKNKFYLVVFSLKGEVVKSPEIVYLDFTPVGLF